MSAAAQNMMVETVFGLLTLLLAMMLVAIVRLPPGAGTSARLAVTGLPGAQQDVAAGEDAADAFTPVRAQAAPPGRVAQPAPVAHAGPRAARQGRSRGYMPKHGRGRVPPPRQPGPPWAPADAPPRQNGG